MDGWVGGWVGGGRQAGRMLSITRKAIITSILSVLP